MQQAKAIVFGSRAGDAWRAGRTLRGVRLAGLLALDCVGAPGQAIAEAIRAVGGPVFLIRAGAWPVARRLPVPPASATGRPLLALGAVRARGAGTSDTQAWARAYAANRGDFASAELPPLVSAFLDATLAGAVAQRPGSSFPEALAAAAADLSARVVHFGALDVWDEEGLRVAEVVTSLHQGGGERIAVELARSLPARGIRTRLVALGSPQRPLLKAPAGTLDLSRRAASPRELRSRLRRALARFGSDVAHLHLAPRGIVRGLASAGFPVVVTLHNTRESWPPGTTRLRTGEVALLVGCAQRVEVEMRDAGLPRPQRTVWNGIDFGAYRETESRVAASRTWRTRLGVSAEDFVLLAVANPRPQKRLPLLPEILRATQAAFEEGRLARRARLVLAGAPGRREESQRALAAFLDETARLGLTDDVRHVGSVEDLAPLYLAADALVSPSAHEGLSLAHVEALAAGLPIVATAVGGTPELARENPAVSLVPKHAEPQAYAETLLRIARRRPDSGRPAARLHFARERMAEGYARMLRAAARSATRKRGDGVLLVTNNFSTGGAQTSARRLLLGLRAAGTRARAAVLQEQAEHPTPGRRSLEHAGVPVLAVPPPEESDPGDAVERLLQSIDGDPPAAVLLWNAIAEHKLLLADALLDIPIFDVSPGEMYFESLERYFERPRPGLPYRCAADYGARLAGVVVKYAAEAERAATLGAPVHVIPNGVPALEPRAAGSSNGHVVIGTLARLDPRKRVDHLLCALRLAAPRMPPHVLRIAGGPETGRADYLEELRRLADGLRVEFVGEAPEPAAFLQQLDAFALVAEPAGCPNASLEAMAVGLAVVATDVGGMSDQIEDGVSGRLVGRADVQALADALVEIAREPELRRRYSDAARARVAERFSLAKMVGSYRALCLEARGFAYDRPAPARRL